MVAVVIVITIVLGVVGMYIPQHVCGGQRATLWTRFSPSPLCGGLELRSGLQDKCFAHRAFPLTLRWSFQGTTIQLSTHQNINIKVILFQCGDRWAL